MANPYPFGTPAYEAEEARLRGQSVNTVAQYDPAATAALLQAQQSVDPNATAANPAAGQAPAHFVSVAAAPAAKPSEMKYGPAPAAAQPQSVPAAAPGTVANPVMLAGQVPGAGAAPERPLPAPGYIPGGPARVIPGGRTPQSWQVTQEAGADYSPELLASIDAARTLHAASADAEQSAANEAQRIQGDIDDRRVVFNAMEAKRRGEDDNARRAEEDLKRARVESLRNINPNRLWESKSGFQKAMTMIAAAMAGAAAGLRGDAHNPVLDMLQREAETDTKLQLKALDDASGELKDFYASFPTYEARLAAGTKARLDGFLAQADSLMAAAKNEQVRSALLAKRADLLDKINDQDRIIQKEMQGKKVEARHDVMVAPKVVGGGGRFDWSRTMEAYAARGGDLKAAAEEINLLKQAGKLTDDQARVAFFRSRAPDIIANGPTAAPGAAGPNTAGSPATFVPSAFGGKGGFATSLDGAKEANKVADLSRQFHQTTQELIKLRQQTGSTIPGSDARNKVDAVLANRFRLAKEIAQTGAALSPAEIEYLVNPLANMDALDFFSTDSRTLARINMADEQIEQMAQSKIANMGVVPGSLQARGGALQGKVTGAPGALIAPGTVPFTPAGRK